MNDHGFSAVETLEGIRCFNHRENSLEVLLAPSAVAPIVSFGIVYRVGSRHEKPGQTGATHFLEHLMFKGSEKFNNEKGNSASRLLNRIGASYNATTWLDRTCYFETLSEDHLDLAIEIEADRMRHALIRPSDLEKERGVILNELDQGENDSISVLLKAFFSAAFSSHPYRHPVIGHREDVEKLSTLTLRSFYDHYYHPGNSTAIICGDFEEENALKLLSEHFSRYPAGPEKTATRTIEPEQTEDRRFEIRRAGQLEHLVLGWHIPEALHPDMPALVVLARILADGVTSRLEQALIEKGLSLSIHAYPLELFDPGVFQIISTQAPGVETPEVEEIIRRELKKLSKTGPTAEEISRARISARTDLAFQREHPARFMSALIESVAMGDWRTFPLMMHSLEHVTAEDVSSVCSRYLHTRPSTTGVFIPGQAAS